MANDTTGIRLEANLGGRSRAFDLECDAPQFNIVDVTNGNALPFTISAGAPTDSLFVSSDGNVCFGTTSPVVPVHVRKLAQSGIAEILGRIEVSDDSIGKLEISNVSAGEPQAPRDNRLTGRPPDSRRTDHHRRRN